MLYRFLDQARTCADCGKEYVWPAGEQEFYAVMGFDNEPKRCLECRKARRFGIRRPPVQHEITCAQCGQHTFVPFVPRDNRPVYCRKCYQSLKRSNSGADSAHPVREKLEAS